VAAAPSDVKPERGRAGLGRRRADARTCVI